MGNFLATTQASSLRNNIQVEDEVGQVANIDGHVDMQMEKTNLSPTLSPSNHTTLLTNAIHYKSHSKDFQSSYANLHSTSSTISSIIGNHVETTNFHEQEKIPTTPLPVTQFSSSKYEQLFPYPPTGCSVSFGGGNPTNSSAAPDPILHRIRFKRPSTYHGGYEVGNGQLCEPPLDGKCVVPLAPTVEPSLFHNMQTQWGLLPHFNPPMNSNTPPQPPLFTPQEAIDNNPLFFPWVPIPLQGHAAQVHS
ncbi:hypothetical protein KY284_030379 [Solanum tuberosum]|nr:hypothetical protein KY284_030379 [Solanum tuberosum]